MIDNLTNVSNAMLRYKKEWIDVTDELKEKWFFIINRYLSKDYPEQAFLLNQKNVDKIAAMNIWRAFLLNKPYPEHLWSKIEKTEKNVKPLLNDKDIELLKNKLDLHNSELDILIKYHYEELNEELKYFKIQEKGKMDC